MKSKEELKATARELINKWARDDDGRILSGGRHDAHELQALFTEALQRVQDEALNSVLPNEDELEAQIIGYTQRGLSEVTDYIRANMKPAPKMERLSEDDLENEAAYFHLDHPKMSASQMFFEGARWVQDRLLGEK